MHFISFLIFFTFIVCSANEFNYKNYNNKNINFYVSSGNSETLDSKIINRRPIVKLSDTVIGLESVILSKNKGLETFDSIIFRGVANGANIILDGVSISDIDDASILLANNVLDLYQVNINRGILSSIYSSEALSGEINFITYMSDELNLYANTGYGSLVFRDGAQSNVFRGYFSAGGSLLDKAVKLKASYSFNITDGYNNTNALVDMKDNTIDGYIPSISSNNITRYIVGNIGNQKYNNHNFKLNTISNIGDNGILDIWFGYSYYDYYYKDQKTFLNKDNSPYFGDMDELSYAFIKGFGKKKYSQFLESIQYKHLFYDSSLSISFSRIDGSSVLLNPNPNASIFGGNGRKSNIYHQKTDFSISYIMNLFDKRLNTSFGSDYKVLQMDDKSYLINDWRYFNSHTMFLESSKGQSHLFGIFGDIQGVFLDSILVIALGGRLDYWLGTNFHKHNIDIKSNNKVAFLPKLSIIYSPFDKTKLKLSTWRSFKPPTLSQMLLERTYTDGTSVMGNVNLNPQGASNFDLGVEQGLFLDGLFKAYYFFSNFKNLIYHSSTTKQLENAKKTIINGIEVSYNQPIPYKMGVYANYTFIDAKIINNPIDISTNGKYLQNIPKHTGNIELYYDDNKFYSGLGVEISSKAYADSNNLDFVNNVYGSIDKYVLLNLKLGYNFDKNLSMSIDINNVLNQKYYSYYRAPGMSFYLALHSKL